MATLNALVSSGAFFPIVVYLVEMLQSGVFNRTPHEMKFLGELVVRHTRVSNPSSDFSLQLLIPLTSRKILL